MTKPWQGLFGGWQGAEREPRSASSHDLLPRQCWRTNWTESLMEFVAVPGQPPSTNYSLKIWLHRLKKPSDFWVLEHNYYQLSAQRSPTPSHPYPGTMLGSLSDCPIGSGQTEKRRLSHLPGALAFSFSGLLCIYNNVHGSFSSQNLFPIKLRRAFTARKLRFSSSSACCPFMGEEGYTGTLKPNNPPLPHRHPNKASQKLKQLTSSKKITKFF